MQKEADIEWVKSETRIQPNTVDNYVYSMGDTIPVILDNKSVGRLNVNWVQKLGISDISNATANTLGIRHSYTINLGVDFTEAMSNSNSKVVTFKVYLVDAKKEIIGVPCCVGWSGFPTSANLYDKNTSANVEVGVQPITAQEDVDAIKIVIEDHEGTKYDDVYLSAEYISSAEPGPELVTSGAVNIDAINGGRFSIEVLNVNTGERQIGLDNNGKGYFCDFEYRVRYLQRPSNSRKDLLFDVDSNNALHTKFVTYLTSDTSSVPFYLGDSDAIRQTFIDKTFQEHYVTTDFPDLAVGQSLVVTQNKKLERENTGEYARIHFEFPEEIEACSMEEIKNFNGRFLVFQAPFTERVMTECPQGYEVEGS